MKYRAEIDGLRAVAVLSVVLYHAFPTVVRGGFIGVDIFFVISGYLISRIIFQGLDNRDFSFVDFYARRIRRIFPALLTVMILSLIFGAFILLADQYALLGNHVARGSFFTVNFALVKEAGYFDTGSETKPLLHLWSLAVEEQFYIVWPLVLWLCWRRKFLWLSVIVVVALISFGVNLDWAPRKAAKAFFLPQPRFWELLSGSLLAWLSLYRDQAFLWLQAYCPERFMKALPVIGRQRSPSSCMMLGVNILGFALIIFGLIRLNGKLHYPDVWALVPVVGALLILATGSRGWLNRKILMHPVAVWFGLISYPLYLWHWPILSFLRIMADGLPARWIRICAVVASVLFAWLTYRVIERPLRFGRIRGLKALALCCAMGLIGGAGYGINANKGFPQRYRLMTDDVTDFERLKKISEAWEFRGYPVPANMIRDAQTGFSSFAGAKPAKVLIFGDSHTLQYENSFSPEYSEQNSELPTLLFHVSSDFPPTLRDSKVDQDPLIQVVAVSFFWSYHYGNPKVKEKLRCCGSGPNRTIGKIDIPYQTPKQMDVLDQKVEAFVRELMKRGKKVILVLDNPFGEELNAQSMIERDGFRIRLLPEIKLPKSVAIERDEPVRRRLLAIAKRTGASVIDPVQYLCKDDVCPAFSENGELLYKDYDHLSLYASQHVTDYIHQILKP